MKQSSQLEILLEHLREKGITIVQICERLGMDRNLFNNHRRTTIEGKKRALQGQIEKAFAEEIRDLEQGQEAAPNAVNLELKYVQLLERTVEELRSERDKLKQENEARLLALTEKIEELLRQTAG
jgi:transcriptional regulator with XRE-family HTH domain